MLISVVLPLALAGIMAILGLSLTPTDFRRVAQFPRGAIVGLASMALVAPAFGFALAEAFALEPELAVGLVAVAAAPGGIMANLLTHVARGDTALSVTITGVSSLGSLLTVPVYLGLASSHFGLDGSIDADMAEIVAKVFGVVVLPLVAGMAVRGRWPAEVEARSEQAKRAGLVLFAGVVVGAIAAEHDTVIAHIADVGAAALSLNLALMVAGFSLARLVRIADPQSTAITLSMGIHNATIAIAVGATLSLTVAVPAAVYSTFMTGTAIGFAHLMHRRNVGAEPAAAGEAGAAGQAGAEPAGQAGAAAGELTRAAE